jgi:hypothetical protein
MDTITIENEQLIKRYEVENSPFVIVNIDNVYFGTLANYKLTKDYETKEEAEKALTEPTWNNITNLIIILHEILTKNTKS